jgi:hypothetical protein
MKIVLRFASILIFLLCFSSQSPGQDTRVSNVRFEDRGETISVRYDLSGLYGKFRTISTKTCPTWHEENTAVNRRR